MTFKVGDIALTKNCSPHHANREVEIIEPLRMIQTTSDLTPVPHYIVRFDDGETGAAEPRQLKPLDDGNKAANWNDCVWRPEEVFNNA